MSVSRSHASLLPPQSMNAPEPIEKFDREADSVLQGDMGYSHSSGAAHVSSEADVDAAHRRTVLVAIVAAVLVVALVVTLYLGSGPSSSDLDVNADEPAGFAPEIALPQAPGLSSASRAFSPSSVLLPWVDATHGGSALPDESLSDIGSRLAPEWKLAFDLKANPEAFSGARSPAQGAQGAPGTGAKAASGRLDPASEALAHAPALPADAPSSPEAPSVAVTAAPDVGLVYTEVVHPGITRRTYVSPATLLAQQIAECDKQGFLAGQACRARVCSGQWGKVPACPREEPAILP